MVKFHFKDGAGNKHTKTSSKAGACSYFFEKNILNVKDSFTGKIISTFTIPADWSLTSVERVYNNYSFIGKAQLISVLNNNS